MNCVSALWILTWSILPTMQGGIPVFRCVILSCLNALPSPPAKFPPRSDCFSCQTRLNHWRLLGGIGLTVAGAYNGIFDSAGANISNTSANCGALDYVAYSGGQDFSWQD